MKESQENIAVIQKFTFYYVNSDGDVMDHFTRCDLNLPVNLNTGEMSLFDCEMLDRLSAEHSCTGNWDAVSVYAVLDDGRDLCVRCIIRERVEQLNRELCAAAGSSGDLEAEREPVKKKYYSFQDILKWLNFDYEFKNHEKGNYPFNRDPKDVRFGWGQIIIPKEGIRQVVQNKVSDIEELPIQSIKMDYAIPFMVTKKNDFGLGVIHQDIKLSFRYDKEWKYGDITKSIYEVCFWILMNAKETNNFFIIEDDAVQGFMSECVINNQWGIGSMHANGCVTETLELDTPK